MSGIHQKGDSVVVSIYLAYIAHVLIICIDQDHPTGRGAVTTYKACKASWDLYIPYNMDRHMLIILVARGVHTHHPPFPVRLPKDLLGELQDLVRSSDVLQLTRRKFMLIIWLAYAKDILGKLFVSPVFHEFCARYGVTNLGEIHKGLVNEDRLAAIIYKEKLLRYPEGLYLQGMYMLLIC
jgi:hypothetical protein